MRVAFPGLKDNSYTPSDKLELDFTGPLILAGNPTTAKEAANKNVVDSSFASLDASKIIDGTLTIDRLPEYNGDVGNVAGNNLFTLKPTGVSSGNYSKVTVDSKGRVVGAASLEVTDIPFFNWAKITRNKPVSLNGYGITDGIKKSGDVINVGLVSGGLVTQDLHAATKEYVESVVFVGGSNVNVGAIVSSSVEGLAGGFLRANGGLVSKTTYANLYAVIGDTFNDGSQRLGSGKPWCQQYEINTEQSADITGWTTGTPLPGNLSKSQAIVTKDRVYSLGGLGDNNMSNVYTAPINADGTLGAWTTDTSLPGNLYGSQAIVTKDRVYLLGGLGGSYMSNVYTAPINANGTLGTWTTGTPLPETLYGAQAIATKNRVYLLGGWNKSTVYTALINADGTLGAWATGTPLPEILAESRAIVTKDRVYLLGGYNGSAWTTAIYTAPINTDGTLGTWTTGTSLPAILAYSQAIVTKGRVYLLGGSISMIYSAPINADGTLGTWTTGTNLPAALAYSQPIVTKNRVYLLGGVGSGSSYMSTVYTAPILGGLNDYSPYYNGTITPLGSNNFKLPDYSLLETISEKYYIKY